MRESFTEITHLEPLDIFYVGDRHKTYFEYPAHCHEVFELNFVENAAGVVRTIGDSHPAVSWCTFGSRAHARSRTYMKSRST